MADATPPVESEDFEKDCLLTLGIKCSIDHASEFIGGVRRNNVEESLSLPQICRQHLLYIFGLSEDHYMNNFEERYIYDDCGTYFYGPFLRANTNDKNHLSNLPVFYVNDILIPHSNLLGQIVDYIIHDQALNLGGDRKLSNPFMFYINILKDRYMKLKPTFTYNNYPEALDHCGKHEKYLKTQGGKISEFCSLLSGFITFLKYIFVEKAGPFPPFEYLKHTGNDLNIESGYKAYLKSKETHDYCNFIFQDILNVAQQSKNTLNNLLTFTWYPDTIYNQVNVQFIENVGIVCTQDICQSDFLRTENARVLFSNEKLLNLKKRLLNNPKDRNNNNRNMYSPFQFDDQVDNIKNAYSKFIFDWRRKVGN